LIKKCRELNTEIVQNAAKVQTALRLSTEDRNNLALLKREIDKAWKMVDAATERETRARETIQQLKNEIQNLGKLVNEVCLKFYLIYYIGFRFRVLVCRSDKRTP
jgi:uncharacterized protein YjaG (DUF416 family)